MVQNRISRSRPGSRPTRRGRPRAFDPEVALQQAIEAFWNTGFSGTSLDDVSAATGLNRPSLYLAFGDKRALYLKALDRYWGLGYAAMRQALAGDRSLKEALIRVYESALAIYFSGNGHPRGCFAIGTAITEAVQDAKIRRALGEGLRQLDEYFETRIRAAQKRGEVSRDADPVTLALLASATLHSIAIRARAGAKRSELEQLAQKVVCVICSA